MDISSELRKIVASNEELKKEKVRDLSPYLLFADTLTSP